MKNLLFILLHSLFIANCAHTVPQSENKITVGKQLQAHQYDSLYFSGQPESADIKKLKEQGFKKIINLRNQHEYDDKSERTLVTKLGMVYRNIPFPENMTLTDEYIAEVYNEIKANREKGKTLVHCRTGNMVGIWIGGHFYRDHGLSKEDSIKTAKSLGLSNSKALNKLKEYLNKP